MNDRPPPNHRTSRSGLFRAGFLPVLAAVCTTGLQAQTQPAQTAAPEDSEIVTLSAFEVTTNRDVGYRATNSIAGTRTNTPIKDVPLNIQVFTKDLAEDLLIKNQVEFESYNASLVGGGVDRFSDNHIQQPYEQFLFRGFKQNWGLRDGVREYDPVDTQNLARVEVVKGPAAALYGLAYPGGIMQNISKTVDFSKNFTSLRLTAGAYGDYRASADMNVTATVAGNQKFGVRFNGAYEKTEDSREHSQGDVRLLAVEVAWQPTPTTKVEFMAEDGYRAKPNGLGYFTTNEAGATGNEAQIPLQILHPDISWEWNWANDVNLNVLETKLYRGTVSQQIGENFQVQGYMQYSRRLEIPGNGWDAAGSGGANAWESADSGWDQATNTIRSTYNYRDWGNQMHAYGATAVYKLNFEPIKNTFAFGANVWKEDELSRRHTPANPLASALTYPVREGVPITVPMFPPADLRPQLDGQGYHHEDNSNDYYFASWQASMLNDRLKTNIGINKTNLKTVAWGNGLDTNPNIYKASKWSPLYGVVFEVTKEISLFAVRSTSLFPDSTKDSFGNQFSPLVGLGYEGGVKIDLLDGKITGTVSYFQITQEGGTQRDPAKESRDTVRYDSLTPEQRQIEFGGVRPLGDIVQGGEQESKGFDIDVTYQPIRELQIMTSFSHVNHEFTRSALPETLGQTYPYAIKNRYALLGKYTFLNGSFKGGFVGLGIAGGSKQLMDYKRRTPSGGVYDTAVGGPFIDVARYEPARMTAEFFAGYRWKVGNSTALVQLNVKNLTRADSYAGWKATGSANVLSMERYEVPTPLVYRVTFGFDF